MGLGKERLQSIVENSCGGCYGIEWTLSPEGCLAYSGHYNPQWRIEGAQKMGLKSLYTTHSSSYSFMPGEGLVGKAFSDNKMVFAQDLQALSEEAVQAAMFGGDTKEFKRVDLAQEYGIHSAVFLPVAGGVLEIGSTHEVAAASDVLSETVLTAIKDGSDIPLRPKMANKLPMDISSPRLEELVEGSDGTCYGIEWAMSPEGRLAYKGHYNPQWRIEGVQKMGLKSLYTTHSSSYSFMPGEGLVGKAFSDMKMIFAQDLQALPEEAVQAAMFGGDTTEFKRVDLAKEYGIHSAVFLPVAGGVLEIGSTHKVASAFDFLSETVLTAFLDRR